MERVDNFVPEVFFSIEDNWLISGWLEAQGITCVGDWNLIDRGSMEGSDGFFRECQSALGERVRCV